MGEQKIPDFKFTPIRIAVLIATLAALGAAAYFLFFSGDSIVDDIPVISSEEADFEDNQTGKINDDGYPEVYDNYSLVKYPDGNVDVKSASDTLLLDGIDIEITTTDYIANVIFYFEDEFKKLDDWSYTSNDSSDNYQATATKKDENLVYDLGISSDGQNTIVAINFMQTSPVEAESEE